MQPINYITDVKNPFESTVQGIQTGIGLSQAMDQAQARQQALKQQEFQLEQQKQMQADLGALAAHPNPTAQDYAAITTKYPVLAEHFKNTWSMLNTDQQQTRLSQASQVYAALNAGKPEIAADLAAKQAQALKNSGLEQDSQAMDTLSKLITASPETAKTSTGLLLSSVMGPDKFASTFATMEKLPGEVAAGEATAVQKAYEAKNTPQRLDLENRYKGSEIRNIDSQISERSGRLGLDRDKLQTETELKLYELNQKTDPNLNLSGDAKTIINNSTIASVAADQASTQMSDLANRLEQQGGGYGAFGSASEWMKKATGNQDAMTLMRQEYVRIRSSQVSKMLPTGPASDKDVALALSGFPPDTADSKTMASFLRGMAKLNTYTSVVEDAKSEWVNSVGHLGRAKGDISVAGVSVPAGTNFSEFAKKYIGEKVKQRMDEQAQSEVANRSYMRHAQGGQ